jgi:hypothetical protein
LPVSVTAATPVVPTAPLTPLTDAALLGEPGLTVSSTNARPAPDAY